LTGIITTHELADRLGCHSDAIDYLVKTGRIPAGQRIGRTNVWTQKQAETIVRWWAERERVNAGCCYEE
jgi:hypothetical protein